MQDTEEAAASYRRRADEMRAIARDLTDEESREKLNDIADEYEELARLAVAMSKAVSKRAKSD